MSAAIHREERKAASSRLGLGLHESQAPLTSPRPLAKKGDRTQPQALAPPLPPQRLLACCRHYNRVFMGMECWLMCVVCRMTGAQVCSVIRRLFCCSLVGLLVVLSVPLFLSFLAMPGLCCFLRVTPEMPSWVAFPTTPHEGLTPPPPVLPAWRVGPVHSRVGPVTLLLSPSPLDGPGSVLPT